MEIAVSPRSTSSASCASTLVGRRHRVLRAGALSRESECGRGEDTRDDGADDAAMTNDELGGMMTPRGPPGPQLNGCVMAGWDDRAHELWGAVTHQLVRAPRRRGSAAACDFAHDAARRESKRCDWCGGRCVAAIWTPITL